MSIRVFVTGGTFDKEYDEIRGELAFGDTHLPEMLRRGRCELPLTVRTLMMVDSLHMGDADRQLIVRNCEQAAESHIVITHGTDTMVDTAAVLAEALGGSEAEGANRTVVLTGAMIPYTFGSSDGLFNLGSALSFVQVLPPGVYIAMNGQVFPWNGVRKNRKTGRFETVE
jgi:L-asparaginase